MLKPLLALTVLALALPLQPRATGTSLPSLAQDRGKQKTLDPKKWTEAMTHEFAEGRVRAPEGQGAMGTSALTTRMGEVYAQLLVDLRSTGQVSIFMGWNPPTKTMRNPKDELRVRFDTTDGKSHVVQLAAGGGVALQFLSPETVDTKLLKSFTLLHKTKAKWLKGK